MGWAVLVVLAALAAIFQHSWLAQWPLAPDLPLALVAWLIVDGDERNVLIRAFVVGAIRDCVDPASCDPGSIGCFHTLAYFLLALAFLPARGLVFRTRAVGWAGFAMLASVLLANVDRWLTGGDANALVLIAVAMLTGAATLLGWPFRFVPAPLHPAGKGGA